MAQPRRAQVLLRPSNDILFQRVSTATAEVVVPVLAAMITEGAHEGTFDVADPELTAEVIVGLSQGRQAAFCKAAALAIAGDIGAATDMLGARMQAEGATIDRLLCLTPGSVPLSNPQEYHRMLTEVVGLGGESVGADAPTEKNPKRKDK